MSGFLYAVPGGSMVTLKRLEEIGLSKIWSAGPDTVFTQRQVGTGPGNRACSVVQLGEDARSVVYRPDEQIWVESHNKKYHIGIFKDRPPGEKDLRRETMLTGHEVQLAGNSEKWIVPIARMIQGGSMMPQTLILGRDGEVVTEGLPEYARFCEKSEMLWRDFLQDLMVMLKAQKTPPSQMLLDEVRADDGPMMTLSEKMQFAIEALAWNYRVSVEEVNLLKLITTDNLHLVLEAVVDVPTILRLSSAMQKKNSTG